VAEDGYEEQIIIPKEQRDLAAEEGIGTENKQKVAVRILNLNTGESYTGRLAINGSSLRLTFVLFFLVKSMFP